MKVSYFAKVIDHNNKAHFEFPVGTLLDKINDEWAKIIDYYKNYFPFAIGQNDGNYREITREEYSTNKFIRLFGKCYQDKRIKRLCTDYNRICVDGYPLCISDNQIYFCGRGGDLFRNAYNGLFYIGKVDAIYVHEEKIKQEIYEYDDAPLLVISDLFFD